MSMLQTVGFDNQIFRLQRAGGISRYFSTLIDSLRVHSIEVRSALFTSNSLWRQSDIVHATYYVGRPYRLGRNQCLVSTLHDMAPERHPEHFFLPWLRSPHANKANWLKASDLVICVSAASADDLSFYMPSFSGSIKIIHHATSISTVLPVSIPSLVTRPFWLMVGKRYAYKNGFTLLRALSLLRQNISSGACPHIIVFAGGGAFTSSEISFIRSNRLDDYVLHIEVDDTRLAWLYRNAEAVLIPSIIEGFSLPLIEALVCDTPLLVSDIEAHREIGGRFSHLISPLNSKSWMESFGQSYRHSLARPSMLLGHEDYNALCKYYSVNRFASAHYDAYNAC